MSSLARAPSSASSAAYLSLVAAARLQQSERVNVAPALAPTIPEPACPPLRRSTRALVDDSGLRLRFYPRPNRFTPAKIDSDLLPLDLVHSGRTAAADTPEPVRCGPVIYAWAFARYVKNHSILNTDPQSCPRGHTRQLGLRRPYWRKSRYRCRKARSIHSWEYQHPSSPTCRKPTGR